MPAVNHIFSVVARHQTRDGTTCYQLPDLRQNQVTSTTAHDCLRVTKVPLAKGCHRLLSTEWHNLSPCRRLFFPLSGGADNDHHHSCQYYPNLKSYLFQTWDPRTAHFPQWAIVHLRQWATVHLRGDGRLCSRIQLCTCY